MQTLASLSMTILFYFLSKNQAFYIYHNIYFLKKIKFCIWPFVIWPSLIGSLLFQKSMISNKYKLREVYET
jgi:hypothetical protein